MISSKCSEHELFVIDAGFMLAKITSILTLCEKL